MVSQTFQNLLSVASAALKRRVVVSVKLLMKIVEITGICFGYKESSCVPPHWRQDIERVFILFFRQIERIPQVEKPDLFIWDVLAEKI